MINKNKKTRTDLFRLIVMCYNKRMIEFEIRPPSDCANFSACNKAQELVARQPKKLEPSPNISDPIIQARCEPYLFDGTLRKISVHSKFSFSDTGEARMTKPVEAIIECPLNAPRQ